MSMYKKIIFLLLLSLFSNFYCEAKPANKNGAQQVQTNKHGASGGKPAHNYVDKDSFSMAWKTIVILSLILSCLSFIYSLSLFIKNKRKNKGENTLPFKSFFSTNPDGSSKSSGKESVDSDKKSNSPQNDQKGGVRNEKGDEKKGLVQNQSSSKQEKSDQAESPADAGAIASSTNESVSENTEKQEKSESTNNQGQNTTETVNKQEEFYLRKPDNKIFDELYDSNSDCYYKVKMKDSNKAEFEFLENKIEVASCRPEVYSGVCTVKGNMVGAKHCQTEEKGVIEKQSDGKWKVIKNLVIKIN